MNTRTSRLARLAPLAPIGLALVLALSAHAQVAVRAATLHTMAGPALSNAVVVITDGRIAAVGPADSTPVPDGYEVLDAAVVTPGLIDAHATVGLTGILNIPHDQDQFEHSAPIQPELRALDAYNPREELVAWVRSFGVTTVHTGHAPGELISGQTFIVKTHGDTVADVLVRDAAMVAATLGDKALKPDAKSPGTRAKSVAMLRAELIKAQEYAAKRAGPDADKRPDQDLRLDALARVLAGELPLLVTADRARDIEGALRLAEEFKFRLVLDSAAEGYLLTDRIKAAGVPVIAHPPMYRFFGELENATMESAARLRDAGIPVALQSGYESYVPKVRVVLHEAAIAAANGLGFDGALRAVTIDAAAILGVQDRVGSVELGKDGDLALYDADPFEYTSHCVGVIIQGQVVSREPR